MWDYTVHSLRSHVLRYIYLPISSPDRDINSRDSRKHLRHRSQVSEVTFLFALHDSLTHRPHRSHSTYPSHPYQDRRSFSRCGWVRRIRASRQKHVPSEGCVREHPGRRIGELGIARERSASVGGAVCKRCAGRVDAFSAFMRVGPMGGGQW